MSRYTPGPWEVRKLRDAGIHSRGTHFEILHPLITEDGEYKGRIGGYHIIVSETVGSKISEADARLIAAAPELLEACEWFMMVKYTLKGNMPIEYKEAVEKCRAAIAKAVAA